jgi:glycogenin
VNILFVSTQLFQIRSSFAAAPDIFPPDKFNAGVLVIEPNAQRFTEMLSLIGTLPSHDGGDTGFLNSYFRSWYSGPPESRLSFGYNAQRTLYWFTHQKQPGYWQSISPLKVDSTDM